MRRKPVDKKPIRSPREASASAAVGGENFAVKHQKSMHFVLAVHML